MKEGFSLVTSNEKKKSRNYWEKNKPEMMLQYYAGTLSKSDRWNLVNFTEGAKTGLVSTSDLNWQHRMESLRCEPDNIIWCDNTAEIREYDNVPIRYIKLPSPPKRMNKVIPKRKTWKEWVKDDEVVVCEMDYAWEADERETNYTWCISDSEISVQTANLKLQDRLESLGIKPDVVTVFNKMDKTDRTYKMPKNWMKMPSNRGRS